MAHGKEGDGQAGSKEDDEVEGQLVPGSEKAFQAWEMFKVHVLGGDGCGVFFGVTASLFGNSPGNSQFCNSHGHWTIRT